MNEINWLWVGQVLEGESDSELIVEVPLPVPSVVREELKGENDHLMETPWWM